MNDGIVKKSKAPPKTAKGTNKPRIKKKRVYTEKELNIPALNMITPVGVEKPKMGKQGKVFVDDKVRSAPGWKEKVEFEVRKLTDCRSLCSLSSPWCTRRRTGKSSRR